MPCLGSLENLGFSAPPVYKQVVQMGAQMPQPFKHPKTGTYYFRKVVPAPLRKALGRTEFRENLRTKDLREAKRRYPEVAARVDVLLARRSTGAAVKRSILLPPGTSTFATS